MSSETINNKRIAKNTLYLYFRMLLTMGISIYTSRVVLSALGVSDYGLYNVVGGFVSMFTVINGAMTAATQRFISFEIGKGDNGNVCSIFSTALVIHFLEAFVVLVLCETIGLWFLHNKMVIPDGRMYAAEWVYQLSVATFLINILSVPYNAAIIAFERMKAFAYVSIIEVVLKLVVVYLLVVLPFDNLIMYAIFLTMIAVIIRLIYGNYVRRKITECQFTKDINGNITKEMLSFAGWNMFGATSTVMNDQGINVLLNVFFGTIVNAARGVTFQVNGAINAFVSNFLLAVTPQIVKLYAAGQVSEMHKLVFRSSRLSFMLMMTISLPVILEAPLILDAWLVEVPAHTVNFLRLVLGIGLCAAISQPLSYAMQASGKVRNYQIVVGTVSLMTLPFAWLFLKLGYSAESVFVIVLFFTVITMFAKLFMLRGMIQLPIISFVKSVFLRSIVVFVLASILPTLLYIYTDPNIVSFMSVCFISVLSCTTTSLYIGMDKSERDIIVSRIKNHIH